MGDLTGLNFSLGNPCPNDVVCFLEVTIIIAMTTLILVGNLINLIVLLSTPSLRNSHGFFLVSLTVADLGTGVVSVLAVYPAATFLGTKEAWPYGPLGCWLAAFCNQTFSTASRFTLTLLSIERCIAVVFPLHYPRVVTKRAAAAVLVTCWTAIGAANLAVLLGWEGYEYVPEIHLCQPGYSSDPVSAVVLILCLVAPSFWIIVMTSVVVSRQLRRNARRRTAMMPSLTPSGGLECRKPDPPKTVKLFLMVRVMVVAVFVCWVPYFSLAVVSLIRREKVQQVIVFATYWLFLSSSFLNTVIYFVMNNSFRNRMNEIANSISHRVFPKRLRQMKIYACRRYKSRNKYTLEDISRQTNHTSLSVISH